MNKKEKKKRNKPHQECGALYRNDNKHTMQIYFKRRKTKECSDQPCNSQAPTWTARSPLSKNSSKEAAGVKEQEMRKWPPTHPT